MQPQRSNVPIIFLILLVLAAFLVLVGSVGDDASDPRGTVRRTPTTGDPGLASPSVRLPRVVDPDDSPLHAKPAVRTPKPATLPDGGRRIFDGRFLVAYYGTAGSGALGVLGSASPDRIWPRLVRAGKAFARPGHKVQPVFELIVSVATRRPGKDGDYSHDIARRDVERYIRAAHRHGALVVLDLQTGRSDFLRIARRWAWALRDPWVGLALDPEWRMGPGQVPARRIGSVSAAEVNRVSAWLDGLVRRNRLPQKLFMLHQFRTDMIRHIGRIESRRGLAMVQHVDGFGTQRQKLATYHAVARPRQFHLGFKLFYRQDRGLMSPKRVLRIRPPVSFVSYQ